MESIDLTTGLRHLLPGDELASAGDALRNLIRKAVDQWSPNVGPLVSDQGAIEFEHLSLGLPAALSKGLVFGCAEQTLQHLVLSARTQRPGRTQGIVVQGSMHGHGVVGRSMSGQIELQTPIQAKWPGFQYVSFDDLESLNDAMSDQTAFILTSPNDPSGAGRVLSNDYLRAVRELADQHELLWIADDRMTVAGSSGCISATQSLSDSSPDVVLLRGGLMANESGGLAIGNEAWFESAQSSSSLVPWSVANPWLVSVVEWSLGLISNEGTISRANDHFQSVVRSIASSLGSGSVVRDVHPLGGTIGLETDLPTNEVLSELSKSGIIAEPAGPNGILLHLPMDSSSEPSWVAAFANALQLTHEAAGETT